MAPSDLSLISARTLSAILRDEQLGEERARKQNNRTLKNRLRSYIQHHRIPDPPTVPQAAGLPPSSGESGCAVGSLRVTPTAPPVDDASSFVSSAAGRAGCPSAPPLPAQPAFA
ncbi:hypothetical protein [Pontiella desulfatans]|uniref:hypothetical protein n=1 Tax=Pontiella desulfatans TaxID=2750659 RepID=UPI00109C5392|nr:hypothetical protein [Pontiella desulfatans]